MYHKVICPICTNSVFRSYLKVKDHFYSKEDFELVACTGCALKITQPIPGDNEMPRYYHSEAYISHKTKHTSIQDRIYGLVQRINLRRKYKSINKIVPRGTWLDYGAGNGAFVKYVQNKEQSIIGIEPSEEARNYALEKEIYLNDLAHLDKIPDQSLACISLWHVLEHVQDINTLLKKFSSKLKPNGILLIAVPNHHSYDARFYKEFWAAYDVPRHIYHFTEINIRDLFLKHNIEHKKTRGMLFDSYYVSLLSEKYRKGSSIRGVLIGFLSNFYARVSGYPFSSQVYFGKKPS